MTSMRPWLNSSLTRALPRGHGGLATTGLSNFVLLQLWEYDLYESTSPRKATTLKALPTSPTCTKPSPSCRTILSSFAWVAVVSPRKLPSTAVVASNIHENGATMVQPQLTRTSHQMV